jgi:hypothetical protein
MLTKPDLRHRPLCHVSHPRFRWPRSLRRPHSQTRKCPHENLLRLELSVHSYHRLCEALSHHIILRRSSPTQTRPLDPRLRHIRPRMDTDFRCRRRFPMRIPEAVGGIYFTLLQ